ncbi:putative Ig domain-containing protein [Burkholderia ubonensis]|uniref:putative Ig domain-containing protein n=1 Tax=Burkholderia ubonensis TaxID=101571 RepID=UPI00075DCEB3|nr:LamG-like jellyroll fold domain-containing protein [Burkholderia ubonensis]KVP39791.1 hypothetical protein WJ87_06300 [Burkholderia ubonensis]
MKKHAYIAALALAFSSLAAQAADYYLVIPFKDKVSHVKPAELSVTLSTFTLPRATEGTAYAYDLKTLLQVKGDAAFDVTKVSWTLSAGTLPAGIVLRPDGILSGTPTESGSQAITVRATYQSASGEQTYQLVTVALTVDLKSTTPPPAMVTKAYSLDLQPLLTSNDPSFTSAKATWSVSAGTLPAGLTLNKGVIAGTPTTAASSTFTVKAGYLARSASQDYTIKVDPAAGLLMAMDGADGATSFIDSGPAAVSFVAQGNARITTAKFKSGGASAYFDKTANTRIYATAASAAGLNLATSDFTVEAWVNPEIVESYYGHILGKGNGVTAGSWTLVMYNSKFCWNLAPCSKTTPVAGNWYHIAVTRSGGTTRLFINGVLEGSQADSTSYVTSGSTGYFTIGDRIGGDPNQQYPIKGYVDNVRVVVGSALYTGNFTPSASLPNY